MELTQLKYFIEAAKTENLSKAARNLHISQPSLSRSISQLEAELGTPLFQRDGRRVHLNNSGRAFLKQIAPAVTRLQEAKLQFSDTADKNRSRLTVGIWGGSDALIDCIHAFLRERPDVVFVINSHIENIVRLDIRDYDLLLYADGNDYFAKYRGIEILREDFLIAVHESMRIGDGQYVSAHELSELPMISAEPVSEADWLLSQLNIPVKSVVVTDDPVVRRNLVSAGVGACLVAESESGVFAGDPGIRLLRISDADLSRRLSICFKREKLLRAAGRDFMRCVYAYFGVGD